VELVTFLIKQKKLKILNKREINEDFNNKIIKSPSHNKFSNINNNYNNNINNFQQNLITSNEFSNTTLYIGNLFILNHK